MIPGELPAGSVVELHNAYDQTHESPYTIVSSGTAAKPVFIRGTSTSTKPTISRAWELTGTYYILENLEFTGGAGTSSVGLSFLGPTSFASLRHSDLHGNLVTGGIGVVSYTSDTVSNVVIYDNLIHDNGDINASFDQDVHGIAVNQLVDHLWVIDNELYRNSGDGIQISAGSLAKQATVHHIYVGRNVSHGNKQDGFWTKQAVDVIFSQNTAYNHRPSNSSMGMGMGSQYAPERVWFLFNHIYDCEYGIGTTSSSGLGFGTNFYLIGNLIHNIHHTEAHNPDSAWSQAAIMLVDGVNRYILNNTIYDVDAGINSPSSGNLYIVNNIISTVTDPLGNHIFIESGPTATASTMNHNLFEGAVRIKWGPGRAYDLASFQAAFPGEGRSSVNANPLFRDAPHTDFRLQMASPAVDAGTKDAVYSTFFSLYGIDIAKDIAGTPRPQGPRFDLGAYEFATQPTGQPTPPAAPTQLRVR
jgi:hypothetical protein